MWLPSSSGMACNFVARYDIGFMSKSAEPVRLVRPEKKRRRIPVAVILALSFGTLVFLAVGGVLALSVGANFRNTFDLLGAQSTLLVDAMEDCCGLKWATPKTRSTVSPGSMRRTSFRSTTRRCRQGSQALFRPRRQSTRC